ncbi:MAG: GmrSD restriction endonuclease domain-containing protein [Methylocystis sp.]|uniref:GmrSD restriction endonuclease domain-containing protein n=1 Tax=Methylocystis sp. TaxID=1911079 RepID=UPI003DA2202A
MSDLSIREILEQVSRGQIRIPAFQRGFVWEPDRVAYLMDSIHKKYPFGSLLFWRTREVLKFDRKLGPFELPSPVVDYPVDYVLDGQQRLTSIFCVFQSGMEIPKDTPWLPIFFDMEAEPTAQDSQFVALAPENADQQRYFPLSVLFETVAYRKATEALDVGKIEKIDKMQEIFKEAKIPVQTSNTEDKATVAIIFERVNRQGVELDTLQLLSAWTWSEEFQLQDQFLELSDDLGPFGFEEVGADSNLLLRCCSAILKQDASPQALMSMNGADVRSSFEEVVNGVKYSVDYLRSNFCVETLNNLPFPTLLVPLSVFFAVPGNKEAPITDAQRSKINRWFWRACFSRRYSSAVLRNLNADIEQMMALRRDRDSTLGEFQVTISPDFFVENAFGLNNVNTKTFILMLAGCSPRSFISGAAVNLAETLKAANRTEYHHMMPRAFLKESKQNRWNDSVLANMCFLSRADNRELGGTAPSAYRTKMPGDVTAILESSVSSEVLFTDRFEDFIKDRAIRLTKVAASLCEIERSRASWESIINQVLDIGVVSRIHEISRLAQFLSDSEEQ